MLRHPSVQFLAFAAFIAALVAIVSAGFEVRGMSIREDSIGEVARTDIKATRDFEFVESDEAATESARIKVSNSVPPVFDWQEGLAAQMRERTNTAFSSMRQALAARARAYLEANQPALYERLAQETATHDSPQSWLEPIASTRLINWSHELRDEFFDIHINAELSEATFEVFAAEGFSERAQGVVENVIGRVLSNMIVRDMSTLDRHQGQGIYLRRLRGEKLLIVYYITDIREKFVPLARAETLVQKSADEVLANNRSREFRRALIATVSLLVRPNITYNEAKTVEKREAARHAVKDVVVRESFRKGQVVIESGGIITERQYRIVQEMLQEGAFFNRAQVVSGITLLVLLLVGALFVFGRRNLRHFRPSAKDIVFTSTTMVLMLFLIWLGGALFDTLGEQLEWSNAQAWYFLIPVASAGMLIRLVLNNEHAVVFTIIFSALVGMITDSSLYMMFFTLVGTLVGIGAVQQVKHRMALMWSGLWVGAANVAVVLALILLEGELFQLDTLHTMLFAFASGVFSGFFVLAVLPLFETVFGYTTDIKLLELANLNHPLLRELIMRAPGSYHHSMMVGSLSEAAAEAVGANPLLCRVGSYYHDIGKAKNPQYFAENQRLGENPHDKLKPNMSALIIKAHVKDGLEMARQHRLPLELQDFIAQHHGTSLISYFYHRAKSMEDPDISTVDEKDYRYPGPKPQSRETAICLLADGTEAASRALPDPTPARLKGLVQRMINKAFTDGQLDECDLTLKDLNSIAEAFNRTLKGIYHHRPEYPEQKKRTPRQTPATGTAQPASQPPPRGRQADAAKTNESKKTPTREVPAADSSSDVWEITKERVESMQRDADVDGNNDSGDSRATSKSKGADTDDSQKGRESLPRLGPG
ncbi:HD family phosphohydrolase [Bradymonas sediminis]|uniref:HD family phosphohydrolase n=1 Tax=Bradymonas sediminis TaxID=1548548 RepID=UPI0013A6924D|nr:HDIG domain-containing metalloprotein [Bradymonas sediminis]